MIGDRALSVHVRRGARENPVFCFGSRIGHIEKKMGAWFFSPNGTEPCLYQMMAQTRKLLMEEIRYALFTSDGRDIRMQSSPITNRSKS